jgi:hypothetical protein
MRMPRIVALASGPRMSVLPAWTPPAQPACRPALRFSTERAGRRGTRREVRIRKPEGGGLEPVAHPFLSQDRGAPHPAVSRDLPPSPASVSRACGPPKWMKNEDAAHCSAGLQAGCGGGLRPAHECAGGVDAASTARLETSATFFDGAGRKTRSPKGSQGSEARGGRLGASCRTLSVSAQGCTPSRRLPRSPAISRECVMALRPTKVDEKQRRGHPE